MTVRSQSGFVDRAEEDIADHWDLLIWNVFAQRAYDRTHIVNFALLLAEATAFRHGHLSWPVFTILGLEAVCLEEGNTCLARSGIHELPRLVNWRTFPGIKLNVDVSSDASCMGSEILHIESIEEVDHVANLSLMQAAASLSRHTVLHMNPPEVPHLGWVQTMTHDQGFDVVKAALTGHIAQGPERLVQIRSYFHKHTGVPVRNANIIRIRLDQHFTQKVLEAWNVAHHSEFQAVWVYPTPHVGIQGQVVPLLLLQWLVQPEWLPIYVECLTMPFVRGSVQIHLHDTVGRIFHRLTGQFLDEPSVWYARDMERPHLLFWAGDILGARPGAYIVFFQKNGPQDCTPSTMCRPLGDNTATPSGYEEYDSSSFMQRFPWPTPDDATTGDSGHSTLEHPNMGRTVGHAQAGSSSSDRYTRSIQISSSGPSSGPPPVDYPQYSLSQDQSMEAARQHLSEYWNGCPWYSGDDYLLVQCVILEQEMCIANEERCPSRFLQVDGPIWDFTNWCMGLCRSMTPYQLRAFPVCEVEQNLPTLLLVDECRGMDIPVLIQLLVGGEVRFLVYFATQTVSTLQVLAWVEDNVPLPDEFCLELNDQPIDIQQFVSFRPGDLLTIRTRPAAMRAPNTSYETAGDSCPGSSQITWTSMPPEVSTGLLGSLGHAMTRDNTATLTVPNDYIQNSDGMDDDAYSTLQKAGSWASRRAASSNPQLHLPDLDEWDEYACMQRHVYTGYLFHYIFSATRDFEIVVDMWFHPYSQQMHPVRHVRSWPFIRSENVDRRLQWVWQDVLYDRELHRTFVRPVPFVEQVPRPVLIVTDMDSEHHLPVLLHYHMPIGGVWSASFLAFRPNGFTAAGQLFHEVNPLNQCLWTYECYVRIENAYYRWFETIAFHAGARISMYEVARDFEVSDQSTCSSTLALESASGTSSADEFLSSWETDYSDNNNVSFIQLGVYFNTASKPAPQHLLASQMDRAFSPSRHAFPTGRPDHEGCAPSITCRQFCWTLSMTFALVPLTYNRSFCGRIDQRLSADCSWSESLWSSQDSEDISQIVFRDHFVGLPPPGNPPLFKGDLHTLDDGYYQAGEYIVTDYQPMTPCSTSQLILTMPLLKTLLGSLTDTFSCQWPDLSAVANDLPLNLLVELLSLPLGRIEEAVA